jgi:two-component system cell cycle response regulator CtrA
MRVLLIEDDAAMARTIELILAPEGFVLDVTEEGEDGLELAKLYDYELILLDLSLPDMTGLELLRRLRRAKIETPLVVVSGASDSATKVNCLNAGADDFIVKPFEKLEFVARLRAAVRRFRGWSESTIRVGDMLIEMDSRRVHVNGEHVHLTGSEYKMLELLALRKGKVLRKETILNHLYAGCDERGAKIVDVFICKLRKKLADTPGARQTIQTVWGSGYLLQDPEAPPPGSPRKTGGKVGAYAAA